MILRLTALRVVRLIALLQFGLLLSCYVPPRIPGNPDLQLLSAAKAKYYVRQGRQVQFIDYKMNRIDCTLVGWDESGFIGKSQGKIKKIEYHNLIDKVFVFDQEGEEGGAVKAGAIVGTLACGIIGAYIYSESTHDDHKVPNGLTISFLAVAPATAGLWYLAGRMADPRGGDYESYRFSVEDFMNTPWIWQEETE